jgi:hypothetical protein
MRGGVAKACGFDVGAQRNRSHARVPRNSLNVNEAIHESPTKIHSCSGPSPAITRLLGR